MGLDRAFHLSTILLAAIAFAGLALTAHLPLEFHLLGWGGLLVSLVRLFRVTGVPDASSTLSTHFWNTAVMLAFAWFWVEFAWLGQELLSAGVHFLIALLVNKLFNLQQRRDFLQLYAITLMMVLASAGLTSDLWYGTVVVLYLLAGIWTLLLYQLFMERHHVSTGLLIGACAQDTGAPIRSIDARFFWTTNVFACCAFGLTLVIFFAIPRIGTGFFQKQTGAGIRTAGFSEKVDLGSIGPIKLDDSVVMRVEFPNKNGKPGEPLYLRGMAYDWYNGRSWVNTSRRRRLSGNQTDKTFTLPNTRINPLPLRAPIVPYDILLEPLDTPVLFGPSVPRSLEGGFNTLQVDAMGGIYLPFPANTRVQYRVWSSEAAVAGQASDSSTAEYPEDLRRHFLQLPVMGPRVWEFAREVTRQAGTPLEKARALFSVLQRDYRYSLDLPRGASSHPLEDFLFARKTGYCEHYATALVVLLRAVDVPARLVTGFMPSEWNEYGEYLTVRQRDAHAWVEVYLSGSGWVTFDPTPNVTAPPATTMWSTWGRFFDSLRLQWDRLIVQYSAHDQLAVMRSVKDGTESVRARMSEAWTALTEPLLARLAGLIDILTRSNTFGLLALLGLLLVGWGGFRAATSLRRWIRREPGRSRSPDEIAAQQFYTQALRELRAHGFIKPDSATPREFFANVAAAWQEAAPCLLPLTDLYYRVRFGGERVSANDVQVADDLLARLRALPAPPANLPVGT